MSLLKSLSEIGYLERDSKEIKTQKSFVVYIAIFMSFGGLVWGSISLFYGLLIPSLIPFGYLVISLINMVYFKYSKNFKATRTVQALISLILPVIFQFMLGGYSSSGSIILWSLLALIASLSFTSVETSYRYLIFFVILSIATAFFDNEAQLAKPEILPEVSPLFAAINVTLISAIVFGLVTYFVNQTQQSKKELEVKNRQITRLAKQLKQGYDKVRNDYQALRDQSDTNSDSQTIAEYQNVLRMQKQMLERFKQETN